jgi:hypothetical protein
MKLQTVYETNADYYKTWERMKGHPLIGTVEASRKGHLCFKFKTGKHILELVGETSRLVALWEDEEEEKKLFPLLKEVLVTANGRPLEIRPSHTSVYGMPLPPPTALSFPCCGSEVLYVNRNRDPLVPIVCSMLVREFWSATLRALKNALNAAYSSTRFSSNA